MLTINRTSEPSRATGFTTGLASAIALFTVSTGIAIGWTAKAVYAEQAARSEQTIVLQKPVPGAPERNFPALAGIRLTSQQQQQLEQIDRQMRPEFKTVLSLPDLTPQQQSQFHSGKPVRVSLPALTPEQQAKLAQLREVYRQKVEAILTPEQQEQFRHNQDMIFFERSRSN